MTSFLLSKQTSAVLKTYVSHRMTWVILAIYLTGIALAVFIEWRITRTKTSVAGNSEGVRLVYLLPDANGHLKAVDRELLLRMPASHTVYIDGFHPFHREFVAEVQREFPQFTVRPANYDSNRITRVLAITGVGLLPLLLILHLLSLQFVSSASMVVPKFHDHHWWATHLLLLVWGTIQTVALLGAGCGWFSAVALASVMLVPVYLLTRWLSLSLGFCGFVDAQFLFAAAGVLLGLTIFLAISLGAEADWMFEGRRPDISCTLVTVEAFCAIALRRFFNRLHRRLTQNTNVAVPFGFWKFATKRSWASQKESAYSRQEKLWGTGQRRRLEAALNCPKSSPYRQSLLWRASQSATVVGSTIGMFIGLVIGGGSYALIAINCFGAPAQSTLWPIVFQFVFMILLIPGVLLITQRPFLARHLLMSCGRKEWVRLVFLETARDYIPSTIMLSLFLVAYAEWRLAEWWSTANVALIGIASLFLSYGIVLLLVTLSLKTQIRFGTGIYVIFLFIMVSLILLVGAPVIAVTFAQNAGILYFLLTWPPTSWLSAFVFAALIIKAAHHRWMTWELG